MLARFRESYFAGQPSVTRNRFGWGAGFYLGTALEREGLDWLFDRLIESAGMHPVSRAPFGVELTRRSDGRQARLFAINHSGRKARIKLEGKGIDLISSAEVQSSLTLEPDQVAIVQS